MFSSSSWIRVATGLQLVVSTATKNSVKDGATQAARATQHLMDVSTNIIQIAQQQQHRQPPSSSLTTPSSSFSSSPSSSSLSSSTMQNTTHYDNNGNNNSNINAILAQQRQQQQNQQQQQQEQRDESNHIIKNTANTSVTDDVVLNDITSTTASTNTITSNEDNIANTNFIKATTENNIIFKTHQDDDDNNNNNNNNMDHNDNMNNNRLKEGKPVPSTRIQRAAGFAQLGLGLAYGTVSELITSQFRNNDDNNNTTEGEKRSIIMTQSNSTLLTSSLCRMRGAALKMGQMLSIQDESLLPAELTKALNQVRSGADAMPTYQLVQQLEQQYQTEQWETKYFHTFDKAPFAAASIGQVHKASIVVATTTPASELPPVSNTNNNEKDSSHTNDTTTTTSTSNDDNIKNVVVKVQYPGVGKSIESDLKNLSMIVTMTGLAPKGLFIDNIVNVGTKELSIECDYINEMSNQIRMKRHIENDTFLHDENNFYVPAVYPHLTKQEILVSEHVNGMNIDKGVLMLNDPEECNRICRAIMYLSIQELFVWKFMQTDPNFGNFLYDTTTRRTSLIDFGTTKQFSQEFVDGYLRIVWASANCDEHSLMEQSIKMNFLTGQENKEMLHAHKMSGYTVGEPFRKSSHNNNAFDFRKSNISTRMSEHTSVFLKHRLVAPPAEVYTLHRKLAGAYMLCIKLGAVINCRDILEEVVANHVFDDGQDHPLGS